MSFLDDVHDDLDVFFDDFADDVTYTHDAVDDTISAIFDDEGEIVHGDVITTQPRVLVKTEDVPDISKADTFEINPGGDDAKVYNVYEIMPDKKGLREIYLTED